MIARALRPAAFGAAFLCLLVSGCAAGLTDSLFVSQSTSRFIQSADESRWPARAAEVERVAGRALAVLESDPEVTMAGLRSVIRDQIPTERLTPADLDVLQALADHYAHDATGAGISDARRARLSAVLEQARRTAQAYR